ncbi:Uncharacterised protein [Mycobacteroides abscessus subsp. abscessus]|nr:Uncharacterised protein [Mycobacteroides abscessus subsp. abscessus]
MLASASASSPMPLRVLKLGGSVEVGRPLAAAIHNRVPLRIRLGANTNGSIRSHCGPHGGAIASTL